ncbi:MAG: hypothetical protein ACOCU6_03265 [Nanoarchaeota archaeon]
MNDRFEALEYVRENLSPRYWILEKLTPKSESLSLLDEETGQRIEVYVVGEKSYVGFDREEFLNKFEKNERKDIANVVIGIQPEKGERKVREQPEYTGKNFRAFGEQFSGIQDYYEAVKTSDVRKTAKTPLGNKEVSQTYNPKSKKINYHVLERLVDYDGGVMQPEYRTITKLNYTRNPKTKSKTIYRGKQNFSIYIQQENNPLMKGVLLPETYPDFIEKIKRRTQKD